MGLCHNLSHLTGEFNSAMCGKAIVLIDESAVRRDDIGAIKRMIGNETFRVNEKYKPDVEVDNTALYFLAGNEEFGTIYLEDNRTTERFSIINPSERGLNAYISDYQTQIGDKSDPHSFLAGLIDGVLDNPNEVAKWLGHLMSKYPDLIYVSALHGEDYQHVYEQQRTGGYEDIALRLCDLILGDPCFKAICQTTLGELYTYEVGRNGLAKASPKKFNAHVRKWVEANGKPCDLKPVAVKGGSPVKMWVAINHPKPSIDDDKDHYDSGGFSNTKVWTKTL